MELISYMYLSVSSFVQLVCETFPPRSQLHSASDRHGSGKIRMKCISNRSISNSAAILPLCNFFITYTENIAYWEKNSGRMQTPIGTSLLSAILICSAVAALEPPPQQPLGHVDNEEFTGGLPFSTSALEEYIEGAMEKWHAPGMAVAIINGNETWAKVSVSLTTTTAIHSASLPLPSSHK